jgi:hypothetical protein
MHITFDSNYLYALVAVTVGVLSGFQAIYVRFPANPLSATLTLPGSFYLFTRGAMPALIYFFLYYSGLITAHPFWFALALGTGWEAVLRSQFLLKQTTKQGGGIDELVKGPLDMLRWYQDIFLGEIGTKTARDILGFVKKNLPAGNFKDLCTRVRTNAGAFQPPILGLEEAIAKLDNEFDSDNSSEKEYAYRLKLGFTVLHRVGEESFKTLFS